MATTKKRFIALILAAILIASAAVLGAYTKGFKDWTAFTGKPPATTATNDNVVIDGGGPADPDGNYIMPRRMTFLKAASDYGVSITAAIQPATAANQEVDWSVDWVNPAHNWAVDKTVTDYVTVTPESDGSLNAGVACSQAFGAQVKVTAVSRVNPDASAECLVDYAQRTVKASLSMIADRETEPDYIFDSENVTLMLPLTQWQGSVQGFPHRYMRYSSEFAYEYSETYTVRNTVVSNTVEALADPELQAAFNSRGITNYAAGYTAVTPTSNNDVTGYSLFGLFIALFPFCFTSAPLLNITEYNKLLPCLAETTDCDFTLRITTNMEYGPETVTYYNAHFSHESQEVVVRGLSLDLAQLTF
jgi:hypothetical protein